MPETNPNTIFKPQVDQVRENLKRAPYQTLLRIQRTTAKVALQAPEEFFVHPGKDFSRNSKLGLKKLISILFHFDEDSVYEMLKEMFRDNKQNRPTPQAVSMARQKIKEDYFRYIFFRYTQAVNHLLHKHKDYTSCSLFKDRYQVLAIDGSDITAFSDPECQEAYFKGKEGTIGYNMYHLNAVLNVNTGLFEDAMIKGRRKDSERQALFELAARIAKRRKNEKENTILMADRGYQGLDTMVRLMTFGMYHIIRVCEPNTKGSGVHHPDIPSGPETYDFDTTIKVRLYKDNKAKKANPDGKRWKRLEKKADGSYPENKKDLQERDVYMRVIKRKVKFLTKDENGKEVLKTVYVYLETNLPKEITAEEIGELYQKRWKIENAFRDLKKTVKAEVLHTRKARLIMQEVWIHLTMFNYAAATRNFFDIKQGRTYERRVSFRSLYHCCSKLLWLKGRYDQFEDDVDNGRIPIRPGRHFKRHLVDDNAMKKKQREKKNAKKENTKKNLNVPVRKTEKNKSGKMA
jgi:hypothetical protein